MASVPVSRFKICKDCGLNALEGFFGPPECDKKVVPAADGSCPHHTTEVVVVAATDPTVTIGKDELLGALALLKPVATRSRFAGSQPVMVAVGANSLELRALDGETDVRISHGVPGAEARRTVVPLEALWAEANTKDEVTLTLPEGKPLTVGGKAVDGLATNTLPGPFGVESSGAIMAVPPLSESCTYLVRAICKQESRPTLRYALLELPGFTFVVTDGQRLHVQWTKPEARGRAYRSGDASVLLTKEQLAFLWDSKLDRKQLAVTSRGCLITGILGGMHVDIAFTTGTGQFPDWRSLLDVYDHAVRMDIEAVRKALKGEEKLFAVAEGVTILKDHVRDVIVGWVDAQVEFLYKDGDSPVVVNGSDRQAIVIHAKEVAVEQLEVKEVGTMKKEKVKKVQTSAPPVAAGPATKTYTIGQDVATPTGNVQILKDRVSYLVQLPSGKKRWFSDAGLRQFIAGQPVAEEGAGEAAA